MKTIYDEAIENLKNGMDNLYSYQVLEIIKALERAKKVEKELEEYKISDKSKEESSIEYYNLYKETKCKLKKVEELLELYRYVWHTPILNQTISFEEAINRIDELEEELK